MVGGIGGAAGVWVVVGASEGGVGARMPLSSSEPAPYKELRKLVIPEPLALLVVASVTLGAGDPSLGGTYGCNGAGAVKDEK